MTRLRTRLDRLEAQRGGCAVAAPSVIYICEAHGEAVAALFFGGSGVSRLNAETEAAFIVRAEKVASTNATRGIIWGTK